MSPTTNATTQAAPARGKRPKRTPKPQGQWKIDGKAPLHHVEEVKQEEDVLAVKQRVIDIYSKQGFDSIPADDIAPRFKWLGIYTQRRQDLGGELTGQVSDAELQDKFLMMRVRIDGGLASPERLRVIGEISRDYARSTADFTDRQNIQLHWLRIEDVPAIWEKLEAVGLTSVLGCGDVPRVILGSPVAGVAAEEIIDATPAIEIIQRDLVPNPEFHNLPRKFKSAISGHSRQDVTHEIQDISFIGSVHPEYGPGFECYVGGGLSTNPMIAQSLGAWVPIDEVPEVWAGVARIFRDYGYRRLRNRARLKFLVAEWGIEKFREVLETEYLGHKLIDGPHQPINPGYRDHIGAHPQKDGKFYLGVKPTVGHTTGEQLIAIAAVAERFGISRIRTTAEKELVFLDVERTDLADLGRALDEVGLFSKPSEWRRNIISCTGLEFCKLAHATTKSRAVELVDELEERIGDIDVPVRIALNGCPNSCARTQVADIGFKGQTVTDAEGNRVEGFQVHLGGSMNVNANFGRKVKGHKVIADEVGDYVVRVVSHFKQQRTPDETFQEWIQRAEEEALK
ncbi:nitrite/sulfite reductase [Corynebacterium alimapuense]|uniref:assimilatory sulfite reductase (ferredoxin) n=1 Tax=Corynebacterium alimapuense TaxID=1576874 RepID=A0A3M8KBQ9_9CORY|nr:nitrite/sulfite reductase [Corynebacterium alimapuense]RNE49962.1 sulfite reductase [Corynebacterium alimapuense]